MLSLPIFDLPTRSASGFMYRYILPRMGPEVIMGPLARRPFFNLLVPSSDLVIATGHGSDTEASGQSDSPIWTVGQYNPDEVKGKVIKLVQCDTGAQLGPDLVKNGVRCYMGYDSDLVWIADSSYHGQPWADPYSKVVLGPIIDGLQALLDGQSCKDAFAIEQKGFLDNIQTNDEGNTEVPDFDLLQACLNFNQQHAVLLGDPSATIRARPRISLPPPPPLFI